MKVLILQEFEGYPDGDDRAPTTFRVSPIAIEVGDDFGKMIVGKGLADAAADEKPAKPAEPAAGDA